MSENASSRPVWLTWILRHKLVSALASIGVLIAIGLVSPSGIDSPSTTGALPSGPSTTTTMSRLNPIPDTPTGSSPPTATGNGKASARVPAEAEMAVVKRIINGDTLELAATSSNPILSSKSQVGVRLLEIDAPATEHPEKPEQCFGKAATAHLAELAPVGSTVWIQRDQKLKGQQGRYLLYLWNEQGRFVNLGMVADGYAKAELYMPNDKHWDTISGIDSNARSANTGLWGACQYFGAPANTHAPKPQPEPKPKPQPEPESEPNAEREGDTYLFPLPPPDKDCSEISARSFPVRPGDPHNFDSDGDGIGCEN